MPRAVALVLALFAIALLAWAGFAWSSGAPLPNSNPAAATETAGATRSATALEAVEAIRTTVDIPPSQATDTQTTHRLRLVENATDAPVPDAEVFWVPAAFDYGALSSFERDALRYDFAAFLRRHGQRSVADAVGRVTIVAPPTGVRLMARTDRLFGDAGIGPNVPPPAADGPFAGEQVVRLRVDRTLRARTVSAQGHPVPGITVRVSHHTDGGGRTLELLAPSDAEGLTELPHVTDTLAVADLQALVAGAEGAAVEVDLRALPPAPIDVVVPDCGNLDVVLVGPDGAPWTLANEGDLRVVVVPTGSRSYQMIEGLNTVHMGRDGKAHVRGVACGVALGVQTAGVLDLDTTAQGPARAGETARVELRIGADVPIVAGRLVGGAGEPIVGDVRLEIVGNGGSTSMQLDLGPEGRFKVTIRPGLGARPRITFSRRARDRPAADLAEVELARPLIPGLNEVGTIALRPAPLLVSGRLIAGPGVDLQRVRVDVQVLREGMGPNEWTQLFVPVHQGPDGRFEVRALARAPGHRLRVQGDCVLVPPRTFTPGDTGVDVHLEAGGSVTATLLQSAPAPHQETLRYRLAPPPATNVAHDSDSRRLDDLLQNGHPWRSEGGLQVQWRGLRAGMHRLTIACPGLEPLVEWDIDVPAGGAATDPRLRAIDLRERIQGIAVRVVDATGAPIAPARVLIRPATSTAEWYGVEVHTAKDTFPTLLVSRPVDLVVVARGYCGTIVPGARTDATVSLRPAPLVEVVWADAPDLPAGVTAELRWALVGFEDEVPGFRVHRAGGSQGGRLDELIGDHRRRTWSATNSRPLGRAPLRVESPLPLTARLVLSAAGKQAQVVRLLPAVIDPQALVDGAELSLRADPEAVRAALAVLAGG